MAKPVYGIKVTMHPIRRYLAKVKLTQADFARMTGITPGQLNDIIQGRSYMGRKKAIQVERITRGAVRLEDLAKWSP